MQLETAPPIFLHTVGGVFGKVAPWPATVAVEAMKVN
jgi:hypothetical protein